MGGGCFVGLSVGGEGRCGEELGVRHWEERRGVRVGRGGGGRI